MKVKVILWILEKLLITGVAMVTEKLLSFQLGKLDNEPSKWYSILCNFCLLITYDKLDKFFQVWWYIVNKDLQVCGNSNWQAPVMVIH